MGQGGDDVSEEVPTEQALAIADRVADLASDSASMGDAEAVRT